MDPFWLPQINCTGRTWPNGKEGAFVGCGRRPMGHWWLLEQFVSEPDWDTDSNWIPLRYLGHEEFTPMFPIGKWNYEHAAAIGQPLTINLRAETIAPSGHQFDLRFFKLGGPNACAAIYLRSFGFYTTDPPSFYDLVLFSSSGNPPGTTWPNPIRIYRGDYDRIQAGRCIGQP